jgi:hypothetical protein
VTIFLTLVEPVAVLFIRRRTYKNTLRTQTVQKGHERRIKNRCKLFSNIQPVYLWPLSTTKCRRLQHHTNTVYQFNHFAMSSFPKTGNSYIIMLFSAVRYVPIVGGIYMMGEVELTTKDMHLFIVAAKSNDCTEAVLEMGDPQNAPAATLTT